MSPRTRHRSIRSLTSCSTCWPRSSPMTPEVPFYSATAFDPREQPVCDACYWVGQFAAHGAVRRGGTGGARGRLPGLRGAGTPPPAHPRRRADRPQPRHAGGRAGRHASRAGAAARAARLPGGSVQRRCGGRLLGDLPRWPAGGCTAADVDSPSAAADPRGSESRARGACTRFGAPAAGPACAPARGARAPRLAGRGRHRGAAVAG